MDAPEAFRWWFGVPEPLIVIAAGLLLFYALALPATWRWAKRRNRVSPRRS